MPWPITPDGYGFSLVPANLNGNPDHPDLAAEREPRRFARRAMTRPSSIPPVVINEVLTHTDAPQFDAIELFNPTASGEHRRLVPERRRSNAKEVSHANGTSIPAGGFVVFNETNFNSQPGMPPSFALSSHGESLFLFSGDATTNLTGYSHSFDYTAAANGVSFGRYVISTGDEDWPAMSTLTLGASNAAPRVGPLVINEVMFHPALGYDEFVEIYNVSWRKRSALRSRIPDEHVEAQRHRVTTSRTPLVFRRMVTCCVVPIDPAAFRAKYRVPAPVQIVGPYSGVLQDSGERLRLERPDSPDTNGVPYIIVDEVRYNDRLPWPLAADGEGPSLQRRAPNLYGNEPTNWFASGITPGAANVFNQSPTVMLTSPTNGANFGVPVNITLTADAADADGSVIRVEVLRR